MQEYTCGHQGSSHPPGPCPACEKATEWAAYEKKWQKGQYHAFRLEYMDRGRVQKGVGFNSALYYKMKTISWLEVNELQVGREDVYGDANRPVYNRQLRLAHGPAIFPLDFVVSKIA